MNTPKTSKHNSYSPSDYSLSLDFASFRLCPRVKGGVIPNGLAEGVKSENNTSPHCKVDIPAGELGKTITIDPTPPFTPLTPSSIDASKLAARDVSSEYLSFTPEKSQAEEKVFVSEPQKSSSYSLVNARKSRRKNSDTVTYTQGSDLVPEPTISSEKLSLKLPSIKEIGNMSGIVSRNVNELAIVNACMPKLRILEHLESNYKALPIPDIERVLWKNPSLSDPVYLHTSDLELKQAIEQRSFGTLGKDAFVARYLREVDKLFVNGVISHDDYLKIKMQMTFPNAYDRVPYKTVEISKPAQSESRKVFYLATLYNKPVHSQVLETLKKLFPGNSFTVHRISVTDEIFPKYTISFHIHDLSNHGSGRKVIFYISDETGKPCYVDNGLLRGIPLKDRIYKFDLPKSYKQLDELVKAAVCPIDKQVVQEYSNTMLVCAVMSRDYPSVCKLLKLGADPNIMLRSNNFHKLAYKIADLTQIKRKSRDGIESHDRDNYTLDEDYSIEHYAFARNFTDYFGNIEKKMCTLDPAIIAACCVTFSIAIQGERGHTGYKLKPINYKIIEKLISCGADLNRCYHSPSFYSTGMNGNALAAAIWDENQELLKFLIEHGADPFVKYDRKGHGQVYPVNLAVNKELNPICDQYEELTKNGTRRLGGIPLEAPSDIFLDFVKDVGHNRLKLSTILAKAMGVDSEELQTIFARPRK